MGLLNDPCDRYCYLNIFEAQKKRGGLRSNTDKEQPKDKHSILYLCRTTVFVQSNYPVEFGNVLQVVSFPQMQMNMQGH